ncbi:MAG: hypothetical protein LUG44_03740 [Clostridiales bacterium]|nr:hypothetical protein [Clostridiales bacterium]
MVTIVLAAATTVCAINWFLRYLSCTALLWYLEQKGIPIPSDAEMEQGCKWAVKHTIKDLTSRKGKR